MGHSVTAPTHGHTAIRYVPCRPLDGLVSSTETSVEPQRPSAVIGDDVVDERVEDEGDSICRASAGASRRQVTRVEGCHSTGQKCCGETVWAVRRL